MMWSLRRKKEFIREVIYDPQKLGDQYEYNLYDVIYVGGKPMKGGKLMSGTTFARWSAHNRLKDRVRAIKAQRKNEPVKKYEW